MALGPLIVLLALVAALGLPAEVAAHGGVPGSGRDAAGGHASPAVGAVLMLGVPALGLAAGALLLRRAVRA